MLKQIEVGHAAIQKQGQFSNAKAGQELLALYTTAAEELRTLINRRGK